MAIKLAKTQLAFGKCGPITKVKVRRSKPATSATPDLNDSTNKQSKHKNRFTNHYFYCKISCINE
jgi:hypothetical protein